MLIENKEIDNGFLYYNLDEKYLNHCYLCVSTINNNELLSASFSKMYNLLNYEDFSKIVPYWEIKDISKVFCDNMIPFVTKTLIVQTPLAMVQLVLLLTQKYLVQKNM